MIIVGEKINTSLKGITEAIKSRDKEFIQELAIRQSNQGADYIDVNCGTLYDEEVEILPWLVEIVQEVVDKPCCIDSPNPKALNAALKVHKGRSMLNSITAEKERYDEVIKLVKEYDTKIVALLIDDENGISPKDEVRIQIGFDLIKKMHDDGVAYDDMYIDPLIQPISTDSSMGIVALNTIEQIKNQYPEVHFMCGLSNVSFGLPMRGLLNRTYLSMCMHAGLDGAVLDPGNSKMMSMIFAGEALLNKDRFTKKYLKAHRKGILE
ncbi:MAG: methyltetrahydrofolate cobalamin methyltransferase [Peptostreptococcaceae bacterium]